MQMRKSEADQTVEEICIILSNISKGTACLHQGAVCRCNTLTFSRDKQWETREQKEA